MKGVTRDEIPTIPDALYLFDGAPAVAPDRVRMVCFTVPHKDWLETVLYECSHCRLHMPAWTLEELVVAADTLCLPLNPENIEERFKFFGGSARYCLVS